MTNYFEIASSIMTSLEASIGLFERIKTLWARARQMFPAPAALPEPGQKLDYENDFIEEVLDLRDTYGRRALLTKRQRLRFRSVESAILRDGIWGNGEQFGRYQVTGARRVSTQQEGMRTTVLLAIEPRPTDGEPREVQMTRTIRDAFRDRTSFFDLMAERPTGHLSLRVMFPKSRPPTSAYLVEAPSETTLRRIRLRHTEDGRPFLSWRRSHPVPLTTYSLRWAW